VILTLSLQEPCLGLGENLILLSIVYLNLIDGYMILYMGWILEIVNCPNMN